MEELREEVGESHKEAGEEPAKTKWAGHVERMEVDHCV